jgi:hypothetical protein
MRIKRVALIASDPDCADGRVGLVRDSDRPFAVGPEIAVQFSQLPPMNTTAALRAALVLASSVPVWSGWSVPSWKWKK